MVQFIAVNDGGFSMPASPWLTPEALAELLDITVPTLRGWRDSGKGPKFSRISAKGVRYHIGDVEAWLRSQQVNPEERLAA